jgi:hypothetical protein
MHISIFICYLTTIIPLIEYAQIKENQMISKGSIIPKHFYMCLFIIILLIIILIIIIIIIIIIYLMQIF